MSHRGGTRPSVVRDQVRKAVLGLLTSALVGGMVSAGAQTLQPEYELLIDRGPLEAALSELSRQTGMNVAYVENTAVEGGKVIVPPVRGRYSVESALEMMLAGSKLTYVTVNPRTIAVVVAAAPPSKKRISQLSFTQTAETAAAAGVPVPAAAGAEDAGQSTGDVRLNDVEEEVIVTAQKRAQRPIEIPMSIAVLGSDDLQAKGVADMRDLAYAVPGMMVQEFGPGRQVIFMRGVGNRVGSSALTGAYLDEVPVTAGTSSPSTIGQLDLRTTDLERVEVLKGPQGTLYGAGAVSGTVRFITADPKLDAFAANAEAVASFTEEGDPSQKISAVLNMPVAPTFGLRLAATHENNGGWIDRPDAGRKDVNEYDLTDVRLKGLWRPSDALQVKAMAIVNRNRADDSGGLSHSDEDYNFRLAVDPDRRSPFHDDYELFNVTVDYDFGPVNLLSSSSYIDHDARFLYAFIAGPQTLFDTYEALYDYDQNVKVFSQEVRLASDDSGPFTWTTGVFYQDVQEQSDYILTSAFGGFAFEPTPDRTENNNTAWAVFGDASYSVTEKWKIGAGVRYFEDDREAIGFAGRQAGTFDKVTWRATTSYAFEPNIRAYVNVATGFRSGGFSTFGFPPYDPETLITYETGLKMALPAHRMQLDFAVFRSDYSDYLRRGFVLNPNTNAFVNAESNIGDVKIEGVEVSITAGITKDLTLSVTGAFTDSTLEKLDPRATGAGLGEPGDPIDYIPEFSYTAGLNYDFTVAGNLPGFARVDYSYRDKVSVIDRSITVPTMFSDETAVLDARVGMSFERWSLQVFGQNLTNENGSIDPWIYWAQAVRNRPRTYGVRFAFDFR